MSSRPASETFISARISESKNSPLSVLNTSKDEINASTSDIQSADLAAVVGQESNMLVESNVNEYRDTLVLQKVVAPIQADIVDKPQTTIASDSVREVTEYVTVNGDTVPGVADKFSITPDTVRWANNLIGDSVAPGTTLKILPITGVLVVAKSGDTPKSIADSTSSSAEEIALFNDIDINAQIPAGRQIIVPNGSPRTTVVARSSRRASSAATSYGYAANPVFGGGNTYSRGYCTWHAANRRAGIGRPIPNRMGNAIRWASVASSLGYAVDGNPRAGDVLWHRNIGGAGHVAFVEGVNSDGSLLVSDMNYPTWGRVTYRTVPTSEFGKYLFIH
ncbi:MAG: LysM peptidoglycan-binding domain-containing protein [Candidatus Nomurabacteria bacterium]|nr:MAG: LysM peptidoglycan-binding domain-containing protein [Candidatus Nomurabacteria bacterium]HRV76277.1 LysM peptidoglycan-binding domain-containing protein [Candidatus Saccharimonadales bacterium]